MRFNVTSSAMAALRGGEYSLTHTHTHKCTHTHIHSHQERLQFGA